MVDLLFRSYFFPPTNIPYRYILLLTLITNILRYIVQDCPRVVIEEDDFDDLELYTSSKGRPNISNSNSADLPVQADNVKTDQRTAVEKSASSAGWLDLLKTGSDIPITNTPTEQQRIDYFALCMASHFATVATFVPTDVDRLVSHFLLWTSLLSHPFLPPPFFYFVAKFEVIVGLILVSKYYEDNWTYSSML